MLGRCERDFWMSDVLMPDLLIKEQMLEKCDYRCFNSTCRYKNIGYTHSGTAIMPENHTSTNQKADFRKSYIRDQQIIS